MQGFPWGGSEELWCKVANKALDEKNEVIVSAKKWETVHPKLQQLMDKGASFRWRKQSAPSLASRLVTSVTVRLGKESPLKIGIG